MKINSQNAACKAWAIKLSLSLVMIGLASLVSLVGLPTPSLRAIQAMETSPVTADAAESTNAAQERCFQCPPTDTAGRGIQLFSTGKKIKVTILQSESAITSRIYVRPDSGPRQFLGTNRETGKMVCLDYPAGTEYVFEIEAGSNTFQTGPGSRNPDGLIHDTISCQLEKPVIAFEDLPGTGSDRDFNDVLLEISCCEDKCDFPLFYSPDYFLNGLRRLPGGAVFIGGVNFNAPVSTRNADAIRFALEGGGLFGTNPLQQLNREYVAAQLSLAMAGGDGSPTAYNSLWSPLRCLGLIGPVRLSNGFLLDSNSMLKDLFLQTRLAILENRAADYSVLSNLLGDLHCNAPYPRPGGESCPVQIAYPDLLPLQTKAGYCDRNAAGTQLTVTVYNASSVPVTSCTVVTVEFSSGQTVKKEVTSVPAFGSTPVTIDIPSGCFSPDCSYRITVNAGSCGGSPRIIESRRSNNTVSGICVG